MRVLVTSSRNTFALDIIRKLGSAGHTVIATDTYAGAMGSHSRFAHAHEVTASPTVATDEFIADIARIVATYEIDLIVPSFEEVFHLAARAHDLPAGVRLFAGGFAELARLHDKASFQRLVEKAGVPIPETVVATDDASLHAAIARFPRYFARAAFSRGGVALLTNTGPLAGAMSPDECHPTPAQPWIVQPFVDGPMVCSYSVIVDGRVTAHCTYTAPEQWAHSTGILFRSADSTQTLAYVQALIATLDPAFTGQLSFDWVDDGGRLYAIECNPRPTNGVILLDTDAFVAALTGDAETTAVVAPGVEREITIAVIAEAFAEPLRRLGTSVHDIARVADTGRGWHDGLATMWAPASFVHAAKLARGRREAILEALSDDIVWNGEPIAGMSAADAAALDDVHAQRV